jgi:hypothetical protein
MKASSTQLILLGRLTPKPRLTDCKHTTQHAHNLNRVPRLAASCCVALAVQLRCHSLQRQALPHISAKCGCKSA